MQYTKSKDLLSRAYRVIPSATQTFSKGPTQWPTEGAPNYLVRGEGAWVWDADGNKFLDYAMALGSIILGYNHPKVTAAAERQMRLGSVFSQTHPLEVEVAELLTEVIPCAEMVRFGKNGSDATTAAIRVARAYTGRDHVAICGYHGWHDWYIATTTRDAGIPASVGKLSHTFGYNDLGSLEALFDQYPQQIAAVVMEPIGVVQPEPGFLTGIQELCRRHGAVLIFDEIVTGFRLALGGAQEVFGVTPDLACFGKAMGNGFPISALVGRRDIMEVCDTIFFSGTFGGETISLAACQATIDTMRAENSLAHIAEHGGKLYRHLTGLIEKFGLSNVVKLVGQEARFVVAFPHEDEAQTRLRRTFFMQECIKRGLLYFCLNVPCAAHGEEELTFAKGVFDEVVPLFAIANQADDFQSRLAGEPVAAIFRKP
jgi:glutamate-1-semialdehyde aminotransferase